MPNYLGILTKQELSEVEVAFTAPSVEAEIKYFADLIKGNQTFFLLTQRTITVNKVVPEAVADYYKNEMQYTVDDVKQGQPAGMTLLKTISW